MDITHLKVFLIQHKQHTTESWPSWHSGLLIGETRGISVGSFAFFFLSGSIYFMLIYSHAKEVLMQRSFCFFSIFCEIFYFSTISSSGLRTICSFSVSSQSGREYFILISWVALSVLQHISGIFFTWICLMARESTYRPLYSALLSAFLIMCSENSALFLSHQPNVQLYCLAWVHLSTPPL